MSRIFLETRRLVLREITMDDAEDVRRLSSDAEVMRYLNGGRPLSREESLAEMLEYFSRYARFGGHGNWAAIDRGSGWFLGMFKFHPENEAAPDSFELGYRISRRAWGRGLATEGSIALVRKAFTELGLNRVWAQAMAINQGSRRVLEKAGLRYVRTFAQDGTVVGDEHGGVVYATTRREWLAERARGSASGAG